MGHSPLVFTCVEGVESKTGHTCAASHKSEQVEINGFKWKQETK